MIKYLIARVDYFFDHRFEAFWYGFFGIAQALFLSCWLLLLIDGVYLQSMFSFLLFLWSRRVAADILKGLDK